MVNEDRVSAQTPLTEAPRLWPGATICCIASGPSLTPEDVDLLRGRVITIAINDTVRLAPWAEVLYSSDRYWYGRHHGVPLFGGLKFAIAPHPNRSVHKFGKFPDIRVLANRGADGLELDRGGLRHGKNSGYAAINLAVHLGAARILLLGYDMSFAQGGRQTHFAGGPGHAPPVGMFLYRFPALVEPLRAAGVEIINCTRVTALHCFPRLPLEIALGLPQTVAVS